MSEPNQENILIKDDPKSDGNDFTLASGTNSVWINVLPSSHNDGEQAILVYINRTDEGVVVELYPGSAEFDSYSSTWMTFRESYQETNPEE